MDTHNRLFKWIAILFVLAAVFGAMGIVRAEEAGEPGDNAGAAQAVDADKITCNAAVLLDAETGKILYTKNENDKIAPASTTKVMTAVVLLELEEQGKLSLKDTVTVGKEIEGKNAQGSQMGLHVGDELTFEDVLYGMMLRSGNEAAAVIATHAVDSYDEFIQLMNDKAKELGMEGSHFVNPHGMDAEEHYVTAADMAKLTAYATKFSILKTVGSTRTKTVRTTNNGNQYTLENTNKLIYSKDDGTENYINFEYEYATGLKTGSTNNAKGCLVATAEKDNQKLIALIYGADESKAGVYRWNVAKYLFEHGFENYENINVETLMEQNPPTVAVPGSAEDDETGGVINCIPVIGNDTVGKITVERGYTPTISAVVTPKDGLSAPVKVGETVGTVEVSVDGETVFTGDVTAERAVTSQEQFEAGLSANPVTSVEPVDLNQINHLELSFKDLWYWLIIPAALVAFLIIKLISVRRQSRRHYGMSRRRGRRRRSAPARRRSGTYTARRRRRRY